MPRPETRNFALTISTPLFGIGARPGDTIMVHPGQAEVVQIIRRPSLSPSALQELATGIGAGTVTVHGVTASEARAFLAGEG